MQPSGKDNDFKENLKRLPLSADSLDSRGLYIYDDGFRFIIWFGRTLPPGISESLLGADFAAELSRVCCSLSVFFTHYLVCAQFLFRIGFINVFKMAILAFNI